MNNHSIKGFTLLELSAVILIIGIIIGSISYGASLIDQARLRSIITEANEYMEAINLFEQKYGNLPGDIPTASDLWGTTCDATPSNCNGDGDGIISYSYGTTNQNEALRAWQNLSLAGMIKGSYSGVSSVAGETNIGINAPMSQYNKGGWSFWAYTPYNPPSNEGQYLEIGLFRASNAADNNILTTMDAYSIDSKIDDGYPRNGLVWGYSISGATCYSGSTVTTPYLVNSTGNLCILKFTFRK